MHLLINNKWESSYLDYAKTSSNQARIQVSHWYLLAKVEGQYISYPADWRIIWNYLFSVGFRGLFLKLKSRLLEKGRNEKFLSVGYGKVIERSENFAENDKVFFLAYNHPKCVSNLVLDEDFLVRSSSQNLTSESSAIKFFDFSKSSDFDTLKKYSGWSEFSGNLLDKSTLSNELLEAHENIVAVKSKPNKLLKIDRTEPAPTKKFNKIDKNNDFYRGIIFGLGNYAKVNIIPNLDQKIKIVGVHEIDPVQLGHKKWADEYVTTSPQPFKDYKSDIFFIAGYHHTHADLCVKALEKGNYAVVEKPIATTREQLEQIRSALANQPKSKFFACFHKRYNIMNDWAWDELSQEPGEGIDYFCIVYEIPLPPNHWYNWNNSGSRIVSNGCHWIDHFQYMNKYSRVTFMSVREGAKGEIFINLELENKANFSMTLTDAGSNRLGVRDYIELRKGKTSIYMTDGGHYRSENSRQWLRNKKINKLYSYRNMYAKISAAIANGEAGDAPISLDSSETTLILEEMLQELRQKNLKIVSKSK